MANIYEEKSEPLYQLLDRARTDDGATVLIPDLQRPYVWTPNQVTLLVDSLIRGWPFGTLLMWKVGHDQIQAIPHRQFWRVVDRTTDGEGTVVSKMDPPASYNMVLDGQQRVQSLLLALGGDAWGFKMEDRDWAEEVQQRRVRGRQGKYKHWSKATLCFDVDSFLTAYSPGKNLAEIDFQNVLHWVVTDPADGQSKWPKPLTSYEEPLARSFTADNRGRFIRLSRLWSKAAPNPNIKESQFREILKELFVVEGIPITKVQSLLMPMGELMTTLRDLKLSKVTYLELLAFEPTIWTEDSYNEAIVSIFTRLNTAGRTLTREEITLAWLKVGWDPSSTGGRTAGQCFEELLREVGERGVYIEMDDLVKAVSFIWSVCCNEGKLLATSDLLKGATIRPMAAELARRWTTIQRAVLTGLDAVRRHDLEYGSAGHYSSVNALAVMWAWMYVALHWESQHALTVPERDDFEKKIRATLSEGLDRWLICSQWAGRWTGSATSFGGYAKDLHTDFIACTNVDSLNTVNHTLNQRLHAFVTELETDAVTFVTTLTASSRERVSVYRNPLWVWHRLNASRWEMSSIPLRLGKRQPSLDVDHAVAYALWESKLADGLPNGIDDKAQAIAIVNLLGNCSLLEKAFNISKSAKSLRSFMDQVHEIKEGKVALAVWASALGLNGPLLDAETATRDAIVEALRNRDKAIRDELVAFVRGAKARVDL